jgi:hypothetical protein
MIVSFNFGKLFFNSRALPDTAVSLSIEST